MNLKSASCLLSCIAFVLISCSAFSQNVEFSKTKIINLPKSVTIDASEISVDWAPTLQNLEMPAPGSNSYRAWLNEHKKHLGKTENKIYPQAQLDTADAVIVLKNFNGNTYNQRVPNDNDMAISNDGKIASVINSTLFVYDLALDTFILKKTLASFSDTLGLPASKYDPKLRYDPKSDRFVIVFLSGTTDSTNHIIVGFSKTNNPAGAWNLYALPGSPFSNTTWSDYPIIALTDNELFITTNSLVNGQPWQTAFFESLIWQVDKVKGYAGDSISYRVFNNIKYNSVPVRNLCPIQGGVTTYGPNIYLLSNKNFSLGTDSVFVLEVTGPLYDNSAVVNIELLFADIPYSVPPTALQPANNTFDTNDARVLGGFLENREIQYVQNTGDISFATSAVYHGIVRNIDSTRSIKGHFIKDSLISYAYPNISYTGLAAGEKQSIITFNHSGASEYAGFSCVFYDNSGRYSNPLMVKKGSRVINILTGPYERWGDYSGSQRKYNEPGKVWASGYHAPLSGGPSTVIAELMSPDTARYIPPPDPPEIIDSVFSLNAYPNPTTDIFETLFHLPEEDFITVWLFDIKGSLVKKLVEDRAYKGNTRFTFSLKPLSPGIYVLKISGTSGEILKRKIIKL